MAISGITLAIWSLRGVYPLNGDEPHYLVIGDALWRFGGLDVTRAYEAELIDRVLYSPGLGVAGAPVASFGHVVAGENGVFSWHGYLLGWAAALPVSIFGVDAARVSMVILGAGFAVLIWLLAGHFFRSGIGRLAAALTLIVTYPFLLASVQIFPDFVAGGVALVGLGWLIAYPRAASPPRAYVTMSAAGVVSLLPWLGVKFTPVCGVILLAMMVRGRRQWWLVAAPAAVSAGFFALLNLYAYGSPLGSLTGGAVEFGRDFWIRLAGMILDQDQGVLLFNPILWLGVVGLIPFLRRDRLVSTVWVTVFVVLWVLGAAHPGWYGGGSFIGRYSWGLAILLMLPTMGALAWVLDRSPRWFYLLLGMSWTFSAWVFTLGVFVSEAGPGVPAGLDFYTKPMETWLESYAVLWFPLQDFVPAWYNGSWASTFWANYVWIVLVGIALAVGAGRWRPTSRKSVAVGLGVALGFIGLGGVLSAPGIRERSVVQDVRVLPRIDTPGAVAGGPVWLMRSGTYSWRVEYTAEEPRTELIGRWELVRAADNAVVASGELNGTAGGLETRDAPIHFRSLAPRQFFLRVLWNGRGALNVHRSAVVYAGN